MLNIILCSIVLQTCTNPLPINTFPTYYECAHAGYKEALARIESYHPEDVNKTGTLIKFYCQKIESVDS